MRKIFVSKKNSHCNNSNVEMWSYPYQLRNFHSQILAAPGTALRGLEILIICADVKSFLLTKGCKNLTLYILSHIREPNMKEWFLNLPEQKIVQRDIKYFQGQFCKTKEAHKSETWREESQPRRRRWEQQPSKVGGCQLTRFVCFEFRQLVANTCGR